jgi:hypothetical protein
MTPPTTPPAIAPVLLLLGLLEGEVVALVDEVDVDVVAIPANSQSTVLVFKIVLFRYSPFGKCVI